MPLPNPTNKEKENDFMNRCMSDEIMKDEYKEPKQRYAVCQSIWDNKEE